MRRILQLALFSAVCLGAASPKLAQVQSVYILPMTSQMDQYLANQLTQLGTFQVVADPQAADTILTDRIGEAFEKKLDELYPKPKDDEDDADATPRDLAGSAKEQMVHSFSKGKGTFFLVDRKTRNVVWSVYLRPKNSSPDELNHVAGKVVDRLKRDLKPGQ